MPDLPISGLPVITVVSSSYLLAAVSASVTSQMTVKQVGDAYSSSFSTFPYSGSAQITGSLGVTGSTSISGSSSIVGGLNIRNFTGFGEAASLQIRTYADDATTDGAFYLWGKEFLQMGPINSGTDATYTMALIPADNSTAYIPVDRPSLLFNADSQIYLNSSRNFRIFSPTVGKTFTVLNMATALSGSLAVSGSTSITGSLSNGLNVTTPGAYSHAEGSNNEASGIYSHAEGSGNYADGSYSHAEGAGNVATGNGSHAEGNGSTTTGQYSHAEGSSTAIGANSHTEGNSTVTRGQYSHAEGSGSIALGNASHAEGLYTIASGSAQHVQGKFNLHNNTSSLMVIGDGTDNASRHDLLRAEVGQIQITGSLNVTGSITSSQDINVNGITMGKGAGAIANNTAIGNLALNSNTTGPGNIAIGSSALELNATGGANTAAGLYSLQNNTSGSFYTAYGGNSLQSNTTGSNNTAVGYGSLIGNTTGVYNIAIGRSSGAAITTGNYNTIIGKYTGTATMDNNIILADGQGNVGYKYTGSKAEITGSLYVSGTINAADALIAKRAYTSDAKYNLVVNGGAGTPFDGYNNTVFGDSALLNGTIGNYNIAIGEVAQGGLQSGSFNISMGLYALGGYPPPFSGATSGSYNTAIGNYAMENIGQGSYNVALGEAALRGYTARTGSASYNVAIGASASLSASSAVNNVTIGYQAGSKITTGSWNTLVGAYTGSEFMNNNIILSDGLGDVKFWYNSGSNGIIQLRDSIQVTGSISQTSVTNSLIKADASGQLVAAVGGTDYTPTAYLSAYHTASLVGNVENTPLTMSFSTTDFSFGGITISGSYSDKIKITNGGVYNIQFSAQTTKTSGTSTTFYIWLAKNGVEVPASNTGVTLAGGSNDVAIPAWNFFTSASAGDYYQLMFAVTHNNAFIKYLPSGSAGLTGPAVPSVILTVNRIA